MIEMDSGARKWLFKYARANYWRVARYIDLDDLVQEGYMTYYRIVAHYPNAKDRPHIMSLFKVSFINHVHDLAKHTRLTEVLADDLRTADEVEATSDDLWDRLTGGFNYESATLGVLIGQAPPPVKAVLDLLASENGRKRLRSVYRIQNGIRETFNERLCRLTGFDPKQNDLIAAVKEYFA